MIQWCVLSWKLRDSDMIQLTLRQTCISHPVERCKKNYTPTPCSSLKAHRQCRPSAFVYFSPWPVSSISNGNLSRGRAFLASPYSNLQTNLRHCPSSSFDVNTVMTSPLYTLPHRILPLSFLSLSLTPLTQMPTELHVV